MNEIVSMILDACEKDQELRLWLIKELEKQKALEDNQDLREKS